MIASKNIFILYVKFKELNLEAGDYLLPNNLAITDIAGFLARGEHQVKWITTKENWRNEQIAVYLNQNLGISTDEFLALAKGKQGKLFPDTYKLSDEPTAKEIVDRMLANYSEKTAGLQISNATLTLASIIEREAGGDADRGDIAGVFANRLAIGMKLQSNPTTEYQKDTNNYAGDGISNYKFWQELISGDITGVKGEYNTYVVSGLPPAPICNPGLDAIKVALNPNKNNYYYFFAGSDGTTYFSTTYAEQQAKEKLYLQ